MLHETELDSRILGVDRSATTRENPRYLELRDRFQNNDTTLGSSLARVLTRWSPCRLFARDCTAYLSVALKRNTCTLRTYETYGCDASQVNEGPREGDEGWGTSRLIARQTDNTETHHRRHSITNHISSMNAYLARIIRL